MAAFSSSHQHHPFPLDSLSLPSSAINSTTMSPLLQQQPDIANCSSQTSQKLITSMNSKRKSSCSADSAHSKDKREGKGKKQKRKDDEEEKSVEEAPTGYIHVRARRGQATDSHSLAERVRRERISERMKLLEALVPGCDKKTGKALMLDEIINYVQSLQNQVEFLSMKLASVNPIFYDSGVDLEPFMVMPDQDISNLPSPLLSMEECSPTTGNNYQFMENSANSTPFLPLQPQGNRQTLWEVDGLRQKTINQSGFRNDQFSFY